MLSKQKAVVCIVVELHNILTNPLRYLCGIMLDPKVTDQLLANLGLRIKEIRTGKNLSQAELARTCEMEKATLSKIESGKVNVSFITLFRLARCLNVPISEFTN